MFLASLLIASIGALLWINGVPIGWMGYLYFFTYGLVCVGTLAGTTCGAVQWCQRGRQKRANSGVDLPPIESEV